MKYRLPNDEQLQSPIDVRLVHGTCPDGINLEVKRGSGSVWIPILTLTKHDGMLALWDINQKMLSRMGFDMSSKVELHEHGGHISIRIA